MRPEPTRDHETAVLARERTLATLAERLSCIAVELSDDEFERMLYAMLEARAKARSGAPPA
jgi:hypothetical protein